MTLPHALEDFLPSTGDIGAIFADEISALGGRVIDIQGDGTRLFGRALLVQSDDVTPGDTVHGGIAIDVWGNRVGVHGYTHRKVCSNGAIAATQSDEYRFERAVPGSPMEIVMPLHEAIRDAMRQLAASPPFGREVERMRRATRADPFRALRALPSLLHAMSAHAPDGWHDDVLHEVMRRFALDGDHSLFGVLNAITSRARDESNPALKWELEALGGRMLQGAILPQWTRADRTTRVNAAALREAGELVEVGA